MRADLSENEADQALEALETATLSCAPGTETTLPARDVPELVADFPVAATCEARLALSAGPAALLVSRCSLMRFLPPNTTNGAWRQGDLFQRLYRLSARRCL